MLLELIVPRQLFKKAEKFVLIYGVSLRHTTNVYDGVKSQIVFLEFVQYILPYMSSVGDLIESGDIKDSEPDKLACYFKSCAIIKIDISGDFLQAVSYFDFWVAGEKFCSGTFA